MLHLCGYDHMEDGERLVMEEKQEGDSGSGRVAYERGEKVLR